MPDEDPPSPEDERARIAIRVTTARVRRGWSKEEAARRAGISSITWKRIEDGLKVQDTKLTAAAKVLQIKAGSYDPRPPTDPGFYRHDPEAAASGRVPWSQEQIEAALGVEATNPEGLSFAEHLLRQRLATMRHVESRLRDAEDHAARLVDTDRDAAERILKLNQEIVAQLLDQLEREIQQRMQDYEWGRRDGQREAMQPDFVWDSAAGTGSFIAFAKRHVPVVEVHDDDDDEDDLQAAALVDKATPPRAQRRGEDSDEPA